MKSLSILINTPYLKKLGGVSNHYLGLKDFWKVKTAYHTVGSRHKILGIFWIIPDVLFFILKLIYSRPHAILLNPSLQKKALKRDFLYSKICGIFKIKTFIFIHGWDLNVENNISQNPKIFLRGFRNVTSFFVLSKDFAAKIKGWGCKKPVYLTTTKVNDHIIKNFNIKNKVYDKTILFLARVEKEKGIYTVLSIFNELKKQDSEYRINIVGDGSEIIKAKKYVLQHKIRGVTFKGFLTGEALIKELHNATIYLLPTRHGEGMPTSILEAMAFGLIILSSDVGGIKDLYNEIEFGFLISPKNEKEYIKKVKRLYSEPKTIVEISIKNHLYIKENLVASKVAARMENIIMKHAN